MTEEDELIKKQRQLLTDIFQRQITDIQEQINTGWLEMVRSDWDEEAAQQIQMLCHKLSGASATLGYERIAAAAKAVSEGLQTTLGLLHPYPKERKDALVEKLLELEQTIREDRPAKKTSALEGQVINLQSVREARFGRLIYLAEDDEIQAKELAMQIGYFGYSVQTFTRLDDLRAALDQATPKAVILDMIFSAEGTTSDVIAAEMQNHLPPIPIIYISVDDSIERRLDAVRSGGRAYFVKPVDIGALIDVLDRLTVQEEEQPYRILIVEDAMVQARYFSLHLGKAGMETKILTEPLKIMGALEDITPDLILMDINMPDCSGMELASVIRQIEKFISTPIVYLSAESDPDRQLEAMSLGGDEFLNKNIKPDQLIRAVTARVQRYRKMRAMMFFDGLTGLLNHTTIKERLIHEFNRAGRSNAPLSFAMLDLDNFKQVNDTYGHAVGDRVLRSLSRLLQQRLRKSDAVGRYGGEEFAVVLPNTTPQAAFQLLDQMRENFAKIRQLAEGKEFSVTFSCGVASFPHYPTLSDLSEAADKALYSAKRAGRNRVVIDG